MDGLLIDSENIYTLCINLILREYGKPDLPWKIKAQLQGRPAPEANAIFQEWAQLPIPHAEYAQKQAAHQKQHFPDCKAMPGVAELLLNLTQKTTPRIQIALATSSYGGNFKIKTAHLQHIFSYFPRERTVLGDDPRIPPGRGKPAPDIYLLALQTINEDLQRAGGHEPEIKPEECIVFEDSVPGVEAGRRAGMRVVWVPLPGLLKEYTGREKQVLAGLTGEYKDDVTQGTHTDDHRPNTTTTAPTTTSSSSSSSSSRRPGAPGQIDDGWGELLHSLEDFSYERYGIKVVDGENKTN